LIGVWILRSAYIELVDTKEKAFPFGDNPRGVLVLDQGGRMTAIITPALQPDDPPPPPQKFAAYSGRYRIEPGGRFVTDVDIAWLPTWLGTAQARNFFFTTANFTLSLTLRRSNGSPARLGLAWSPLRARMGPPMRAGDLRRRRAAPP
jgi:hypothetical protein